MRLTKTDRKLISKIAKSLPKMVSKTETVKIILSGESILERDPLATIGKTANSILPHKKYLSGDIPKEINHRKELEKAFLKFGDMGIYSYQRSILNIQANAK